MNIMLKVLSIAAICTVCTLNIVAQDAPESPDKKPAARPERPVDKPAEKLPEKTIEKPVEKPAIKSGDFAAGWNTWQTTEVSDSVTYSLSLGGRVTLEATKLENGQLTVKRTMRPIDRDPVSNESTKERSKHRMQVRLPASGLEWRQEDRKFGVVKLSCHVASWMNGKTETEVWYSEKIPCGGVVLQSSNGEAKVELVKYKIGGVEFEAKQPEPAPEPKPEPKLEPKPEPTPEPEPMPESTPKESGGLESSYTAPFEHGQPLTMKVPEKIKKAMTDQGKDATRLRVYFEEDKKDSGIKVEYGDESTEVPVIFAAFVKDRCDRELPYNIWSTRKNGFVDLAFDVKSRPMKLDNLGVEIIHTHLTGETENEIAVFEVPVPEGDNPWEDMRLPGSKPGINRYTLRLTYKQGKETTTVNGFSHWVIVQAPPMFSFKNGVECEATRKSINGQTTLSSVVSFTGSFRLHDGLSADDMFLRITRKGRRNVNLRGLSSDLRRMVAKEKAAAGWQEVGRSRLTEGAIAGLQKIEIDGQNVSFNFQHSLAITSRVLPLLEDWEYRFELLHKNATKPIAEWSGKIDLHIRDASKIAAAKMTISTTGMSKPMVVKFKQD